MTTFKSEAEFIEYLESESAFDFKGWPQEKLAKLATLLLKVVKHRTDTALALLEMGPPPSEGLEQVKAMIRGETPLASK